MTFIAISIPGPDKVTVKTERSLKKPIYFFA